MLLNVLESKAGSNQDAVQIFIESLKQDYPWLHQRFLEDVPDFKRSPKMAVDEDDKVFDSPKHQRVKTMLEAGGVQCLPSVTVERRHFIETIQMELRELKRHQYLVVQGMAGSGKSVLATQALNSAKLFKTVFPVSSTSTTCFLLRILTSYLLLIISQCAISYVFHVRIYSCFAGWRICSFNWQRVQRVQRRNFSQGSYFRTLGHARYYYTTF